ncbi:MAG: redoxin domain-containing protein [Gammaproteobacteria bacterium]|nr:redoxin domain-containing protein [Gammaproteobacteria bacterium]
MNKKVIILILISLLGGLLGAYFGQQKFPETPNTVDGSVMINELHLPDINRQLRHGEEWLGKVVVVNHWATWCPPCREEIPMLIEYQQRMEKEGVQVLGVAHDLLDATRIFGDQIGINYPSLVAIANGTELLARHGNSHSGALPYTVVFDRNGKLVSSTMGKIDAEGLHQMVQPLL